LGEEEDPRMTVLIRQGQKEMWGVAQEEALGGVIVAHNCNANTREVEAGESQVQD
jgi:hypothetical protein